MASIAEPGFKPWSLCAPSLGFLYGATACTPGFPAVSIKFHASVSKVIAPFPTCHPAVTKKPALGAMSGAPRPLG